jgi:hypothetical protein
MKHKVTLLARTSVFLALMLTTGVLTAANATVSHDDMAHCAVSTWPLTQQWTTGFLSGNGNMGIIMGGNPHQETLIVNGKLYLPQGSKEIVPDLSAFKDEFKKAGLAAGANGPLAVHSPMLKKSGHDIINTDPFHPACLLNLTPKTAPGADSKYRNYRMREDFRTGELSVGWSDERGEWGRRLFVSRPDDVMVMSISGPKGAVSYDIAMEINHPLIACELTSADGWISARNTYRKGKGGYDILMRVIPNGGEMLSQDGRISITGADGILLIMQLRSWKTPLPKEQSEAWAYSPDNPDFSGTPVTNRIPEMTRTLSGLKPDYAALFAPHARAHGALYDRIALNLDGGDDRQMSSEDLLARADWDGAMPHKREDKRWTSRVSWCIVSLSRVDG